MKLFIALAVLLSLYCSVFASYKAVCVLKGTFQAPTATGVLNLETNDDGSMKSVKGTVTGLPPSALLGFHVHEFGDLSDMVLSSSTGTHYNPTGANHGLPPTVPRHVGDMGNIQTDDAGVTTIDKVTSDILWLLNGTTSVVGRAIVIHQMRDDGTGPVGNAGRRLAHCVIGIKNDLPTQNMAYSDAVGYASCELRPTRQTNMPVYGRAVFMRVDDQNVRVIARVCGLAPSSSHGFHIDSFGDLTGGPNDFSANVGPEWKKLGNLTADANGVGDFDMTINGLHLGGNMSTVGRAISLHNSTEDESMIVSTCVIGTAAASVSVANVKCDTMQKAVCVLAPTAGSNVKGVVNFEILGNMIPRVYGNITGFAANEVRAIHVHEFGNLALANGTATGGHYNPLNFTHGLPGKVPRHLGDMGNITSDANGVAVFDKTGEFWNLWKLNGFPSIIGRAVIIHVTRDDGQGAVGNAGGRSAQCVIGIQQSANVFANSAAADDNSLPFATCEMRGATPATRDQIVGRVRFANEAGKVRVTAKVCGLGQNKAAGFHVHEFGDLTQDSGASAGGHYNPYGNPHAYPSTQNRHIGDMGNITVDSNGVATYNSLLDLISLSGNTSIIGRAVIIHQNADDGLSVGSAGTRIASCVIGVTDVPVDIDGIMCAPLPQPSARPSPMPSPKPQPSMPKPQPTPMPSPKPQPSTPKPQPTTGPVASASTVSASLLALVLIALNFFLF